MPPQTITFGPRYDGDLTDIFALQDEITARVVAAIEPKLLEAEGIRSQNRSPDDLAAWDMMMRANSLFWRLTKAESQAAVAILRQVVEQHPTYAPAHSMLAFMLLVSRQVGWIAMEPQVNEPAALPARAAELGDSDPWAHLALGYVAFTRRRGQKVSHRIRHHHRAPVRRKQKNAIPQRIQHLVQIRLQRRIARLLGTHLLTQPVQRLRHTHHRIASGAASRKQR